MNELNKFIESQIKFQALIKSIQPPQSIFESLRNNHAHIEKLINPHKGILEQFYKAQTLAIPPALKQIEQMKFIMRTLQPNFAKDFALSGQILEAFKSRTFTIPKQYSNFSQTNEALLSTAKNLANEIEKYKLNYLENTVFQKADSKLTFFPVISGTAHFQVLNDLKYLSLKRDSKDEDNFLAFVNENCLSIENKIKDLNPDWLTLLEGAKLSMRTRNPEKVRHTITSLRELVTQIIDYCAPDSEINQEYPDPGCYRNGKPTRRTRLHFILKRKYTNVLLLDVVDSDIDAILEMFKLYQKGTHQVVFDLTDEQLCFIVKRTELIIYQLL